MKNNLWFALSVWAVAASSISFAKGYYVSVPYEGPQTLVRLHSQGYDIGGINLEKKTVSLVIHESDVERVKQLPVISQREIGFADRGYKTPDDIEKFVFEIERKNPQLAAVQKIGETGEHRPLYAIQLTSRFFVPDTPKKVLLIDAMHHARELMTPEVAMDIITYLTEKYETDPKVFKWLNYNEVWVIPMLNPDGNNKVWNSEPMWRKNNRGGYGVDINRNYDYAWNTCNGSSSNKGADDYHGPSAGSEPETQAIMQFAKQIKPDFNISYHSYSEIVIYPFGCNPKHVPEPDRTIYEGIGRELASKLVRDSGNGTYEPGTSYELLYNVDGGSIDWFYSQLKTYSFVIEVNSDSEGFQPSYSKWRDITIQRQRPGWMYILDKMTLGRRDILR